MVDITTNVRSVSINPNDCGRIQELDSKSSENAIPQKTNFARKLVNVVNTFANEVSNKITTFVKSASEFIQSSFARMISTIRNLNSGENMNENTYRSYESHDVDLSIDLEKDLRRSSIPELITKSRTICDEANQLIDQTYGKNLEIKDPIIDLQKHFNANKLAFQPYGKVLEVKVKPQNQMIINSQQLCDDINKLTFQTFGKNLKTEKKPHNQATLDSRALCEGINKLTLQTYGINFAALKNIPTTEL